MRHRPPPGFKGSNIPTFIGIGSVGPEKFKLYQIPNGRPSAIINYYIPDIWHTVPDS